MKELSIWDELVAMIDDDDGEEEKEVIVQDEDYEM